MGWGLNERLCECSTGFGSIVIVVDGCHREGGGRAELAPPSSPRTSAGLAFSVAPSFPVPPCPFGRPRRPPLDTFFIPFLDSADSHK